MRRTGVGRTIRGGLLVLALAGIPAVAGANLRSDLRNAPSLLEIDPAALGPGYRNAVDALVDSAARALPVPAASGAFTYRWNPESGEYETTSDTFGPMLFMERPQTLGRNVWRIGVSGQYLELDEYDGKGVGRDPDPIIVPGRSGPIRFFATPKFIYHLATVNVTYGVLDDLDLNIAVPLGAGDFDTNVSLVNENGDFFFNTQHSKVSIGVGDILLRAKYHLCEWQGVETATGVIARVPSGESGSGFGTGDFELGPYLALSTLLWDRVEPQWNGGFDFNLEDSHLSSAHYAFGVNVQAVKNWLDVGVSFLGRSEVDGRRSDRSISGLHQTASGPALAPYEGLNFDRKDFFDFSAGARVRLYKTLALTLSALKGLNDDGLRSSNWSPVGGLEATF